MQKMSLTGAHTKHVLAMKALEMTVQHNSNNNYNNDNINNSNIILATAVTVVDREKSSKLYILHGLFNNTVSGIDCRMKLYDG